MDKIEETLGTSHELGSWMISLQPKETNLAVLVTD